MYKYFICLCCMCSLRHVYLVGWYEIKLLKIPSALICMFYTASRPNPEMYISKILRINSPSIRVLKSKHIIYLFLYRFQRYDFSKVFNVRVCNIITKAYIILWNFMKRRNKVTMQKFWKNSPCLHIRYLI